VEVLAGLIALAGLAFLFFGFVFLFPEFLDHGASPGAGEPGAVWVGVGAAASAIFFSLGVLHEILAVGLIMRRDAARVLSVLLLGLSTAAACLGLIAALVHFNDIAVAWHLCVVVADVGGIWYLLRPQVRGAFRR
jgi:hypothetical protein